MKSFKKKGNISYLTSHFGAEQSYAIRLVSAAAITFPAVQWIILPPSPLTPSSSQRLRPPLASLTHSPTFPFPNFPSSHLQPTERLLSKACVGE